MLCQNINHTPKQQQQKQTKTKKTKKTKWKNSASIHDLLLYFIKQNKGE